MKIVPNRSHRAAIENALMKTLRNRRDWIMGPSSPTITDILQVYPHLIAYEGEMVSEFTPADRVWDRSHITWRFFWPEF